MKQLSCPRCGNLCDPVTDEFDRPFEIKGKGIDYYCENGCRTPHFFEVETTPEYQKRRRNRIAKARRTLKMFDN